MKSARWRLGCFACCVLIASLAEAGSYFGVYEGVRLAVGNPLRVGSYAIVHPMGYTGTSSPLEVRICIAPGIVGDENNESLVGSLQEAIDLWNGLQPSLGNCTGCVTAEEPPPPGTVFDAASVLVHELGHCGLGLSEINLTESTDTPANPNRTGTCSADEDLECGEVTSFTSSANATRVLPNTGGVRGDANDEQENNCPISGFELSTTLEGSFTSNAGAPGVPSGIGHYPEFSKDDPRLANAATQPLLQSSACPAPPNCCPDPLSVVMMVEDIAWFRISDNDPFVIDTLEIDDDEFRRNPASLPDGSNYAANANRVVGEALGHPSSQSVMYGLIVPGVVYSGLVADDVNMVKMAQTGANRLVGGADDYDVKLRYQASCDNAQIVVEFAAGMAQDVIGACDDVGITTSFPQGAVKFHWTISPLIVGSPGSVKLNAGEEWQLATRVFSSDYEAGDVREWNQSLGAP